MEHEKRLRLKPYRTVSEHVDGAWWPRSTSLVDELPSLATSLSDRLGPVVMVGYRRNGWQEPPALVQIAGRTVELLGFTSDEPASVILIGEDGRHVTLNVIRPDTGQEVARAALEQAAAGTDASPAAPARAARSVDDVAEKLAKHEGTDDERRIQQIRRWCDEAAQQFVDAPVQAFVPILVEHIVRNRMIETRRQPEMESETQSLSA